MRLLRELRELSQGQLARKVQDLGWTNFHQTTVSRIEKGERPVRLSEALAVARALETDLDALLIAPADQRDISEIQKCSVELEASFMGVVQRTVALVFRTRQAESLLESVDGSVDPAVRDAADKLRQTIKRVESRDDHVESELRAFAVRAFAETLTTSAEKIARYVEHPEA